MKTTYPLPEYLDDEGDTVTIVPDPSNEGFVTFTSDKNLVI